MAHTATETSTSSASSIIRLENLCVKRSSDGTLSSTSYKLCNARIEAFLTPALLSLSVQPRYFKYLSCKNSDGYDKIQVPNDCMQDIRIFGSMSRYRCINNPLNILSIISSIEVIFS
uniref:Uncharacterized protein n=1 Tax=Opuntia streptacantha TaxID=393608 RepID=A0A7C9DDS2_OPUST